MLIITEILIKSAEAKSSGSLLILNTVDGVLNSSSLAILTSIAISITNEYISKKEDEQNYEVAVMLLVCYMKRLQNNQC